MVSGTELTAGVKAAEAIDKAVGIIAKVVGKLKTQPDIAAQKLGQALGEVAKTLQVVESTTSEFLSLGIDEEALSKKSKLLLEISSGSLTTEVKRGRGHCSVIDTIYRKYLDKWFARVFKKKKGEYESIKAVFVELGDADDTLFMDLERVAAKLEEEARDVLDLVVKRQEKKARIRVLSALPALQPLRKTMSKTMQNLYSMQSDFIDITEAV